MMEFKVPRDTYAARDVQFSPLPKHKLGSLKKKTAQRMKLQQKSLWFKIKNQR